MFSTERPLLNNVSYRILAAAGADLYLSLIRRSSEAYVGDSVTGKTALLGVVSSGVVSLEKSPKYTCPYHLFVKSLMDKDC